MTGSNIFSILIGRGLLSTVPVIVHTVATLVNLAAYKFVHQTPSVYLAFLLFELTVGMFYPSYGSIKSQHVPEEVRSGVMNIFRVPLNAIMVRSFTLSFIHPPTYLPFSIQTTKPIPSAFHPSIHLPTPIGGAPGVDRGQEDLHEHDAGALHAYPCGGPGHVPQV